MRTILALTALLAVSGPSVGAQRHETGPIEIPIRVQGGRLIVQVAAPDGSTANFVLTTANTVTLLSETGAERFAQRGGLTMGGVKVSLEGHSTIPDESLIIDGIAMDGMVSSNTLNQFDVLIDVPQRRMLLRDVGPSVDWGDIPLSEPIGLRVYHGMILSFEVSLNGQEYGATLDVGTPDIVVNEPVGAKSKIDAEGYATLALGGGTFPDLPVRVRDLEILKRFDPNGNGFVVVGAALASDCVISISWVHQEMRTCVQ